MTPEQIELVKQSWDKVLPISSTAAKLFYDRLFVINPDLRGLFKNDISTQGEKLMTTINTAVINLENMDSLVPVIEDLGRRHVKYGVQDQDYDAIGEALLWTLATGLGDAFTDEVNEAWQETYSLIATTMKQAANAMAVN